MINEIFHISDFFFQKLADLFVFKLKKTFFFFPISNFSLFEKINLPLIL